METKMKNMKKALSILMAAALSIGLTACSGGNTTASEESKATETQAGSEPYVLSLGYVFNDGSSGDICGKRLVENLNNTGLFDVTCYSNCTLGTSLEMMEMVIGGQNVAALLSGSDIGDQINVGELATTMAPFMFDGIDDVYKLTGSDYYQGLISEAADAGVHVTNALCVSGERYFWTKKPVTKPEEFAGIKCRVPTNAHYINCMTAFGAVPTPIAVSELYTSLAQGVADGCEFPMVDGYQRQVYEVTTHVSNQAYMCEYVFPILSEEVWNSLTKEQQDAWNESCKEAAEYGYEQYIEINKQCKEDLEKEGMTFVDIDTEAFSEKVPEYFELMTKDAGWSPDTYDQIMAAIGK